jgi:hypothetical protein
MPITREKIRYLGNTTNIKFNLSSDDGFLGYQQEIDNLTQNIGIDLVNPSVDVEERRFKNISTVNTMTFQFTQDGTTYTSDYTTLGFLSYNSNLLNKLNSFYIFEYYDTYDINIQTKIFTTYLTKINIVPSFVINPDNQLYNLYIPVSYMNSLLDQNIFIVTGYTKISFFNAKNGTLVLLYNATYQDLSTPQKMYFNTKLDVINKTWGFINPTNIIGKQLWTSTDYINKVNDTFTKFDNEKQNYPIGTIFNRATGKYV